MADEKKVPADKAIDAAKGSHPVASAPSTGGVPPRSTGKPPEGKEFATNPHAAEARKPDTLEDDPARTVAVAKWSLADFQNIYAALRDGDYYSAFKLSVSFLNELMNAPKMQPKLNRGMRPGEKVGAQHVAVSASEMKEIDRTIELMERQLSNSTSGTVELEDQKVLAAPSSRKASNAPTLNIVDVINVVSIVLEFIRKWRENK